MNLNDVNTAASSALGSILEQNPASLRGVGGLVNEALDGAHVPFENRRYVLMAMSDLALGRANALGGPGAALLRKLSGAFLDQHARWCGIRWYERRAPAEAATRRELALMRREQRELDGLGSIIERAATAIGEVVERGVTSLSRAGAFQPAAIDARTTVQIPEGTGPALASLQAVTENLTAAIEAVNNMTEATENKAPKRAKRVHAEASPT